MNEAHVECTPFEPMPPPQVVRLFFCPACGRQVTGTYNIDSARKRCTKTWHLTAAVQQTYDKR